MAFGKRNEASAEETANSILQAFDRVALSRLSAADLLSAAGDGAAAEVTLAQLVEEGYLREKLGQYERTEAGRLEVAAPSDLTFLSRAGCHLCTQALRELEPLVARLGVRFRVVDIDADEVLRDLYDLDVPVLLLGTKELARHRIDPRRIEAEVSQARRER